MFVYWPQVLIRLARGPLGPRAAELQRLQHVRALPVRAGGAASRSARRRRRRSTTRSLRRARRGRRRRWWCRSAASRSPGARRRTCASASPRARSWTRPPPGAPLGAPARARRRTRGSAPAWPPRSRAEPRSRGSSRTSEAGAAREPRSATPRSAGGDSRAAPRSRPAAAPSAAPSGGSTAREPASRPSTRAGEPPRGGSGRLRRVGTGARRLRPTPAAAGERPATRVRGSPLRDPRRGASFFPKARESMKLRGDRAGGDGVPCLPAAGGVARDGWGGRSGAPFATRTTGRGRCRGSATRGRGCWCSGWRPPRTGRTAPGACSPATARATGSSRRCTGRGSPASRPRRTADDGLELRDAFVTAAVKCAPPDNRPTPGSATAASPSCCASWRRSPRARGRLSGRVRLGPGAARAAGGGLRPCPSRCPASGTPREARVGERLSARRLVPSQPAEHLHRPADGGDARRRVRASEAGAGIVAPSGGGPILAVLRFSPLPPRGCRAVPSPRAPCSSLYLFCLVVGGGLLLFSALPAETAGTHDVARGADTTCARRTTGRRSRGVLLRAPLFYLLAGFGATGFLLEALTDAAPAAWRPPGRRRRAGGGQGGGAVYGGCAARRRGWCRWRATTWWGCGARGRAGGRAQRGKVVALQHGREVEMLARLFAPGDGAARGEAWW